MLGHALFGNAQMDLRTIGKLLAGPSNGLFKQFLGFCELLLMKMLYGLFVELQLLLELRIDHLPHRFGMRRELIIILIFQ